MEQMWGIPHRMYDKKMVKACRGFCTETKSSLISEYTLIRGRKFRADYYIPEYKIAIEVQGGLFKKKGSAERFGHFYGNQALKDFDKILCYSIEGHVILLCIPSQVGKYVSDCLARIGRRRKHVPASDFMFVNENVLILRGEVV